MYPLRMSIWKFDFIDLMKILRKKDKKKIRKVLWIVLGFIVITFYIWFFVTTK